MSTETVYIGLGSNIGDSPRGDSPSIIHQAIECLAVLPKTRLTKKSSLYRSEAISDIPQDDYINAVVALETSLQPMDLLAELQTLEQAFYRRREPNLKWAPRTLDLDIILFGVRRLYDSHLTVPHPEMQNRLFVLQPLFEISGDSHIPGLGNLQHLMNNAPDMDIAIIHPSEPE